MSTLFTMTQLYTTVSPTIYLYVAMCYARFSRRKSIWQHISYAREKNVNTQPLYLLFRWNSIHGRIYLFIFYLYTLNQTQRRQHLMLIHVATHTTNTTHQSIKYFLSTLKDACRKKI